MFFFLEHPLRYYMYVYIDQESAVNFYLSVGFRLMERKAAATSPSSSSARLGFLHGVHDLKFEMKI